VCVATEIPHPIPSVGKGAFPHDGRQGEIIEPEDDAFSVGNCTFEILGPDKIDNWVPAVPATGCGEAKGSAAAMQACTLEQAAYFKVRNLASVNCSEAVAVL
jgi:hypothetical protein